MLYSRRTSTLAGKPVRASRGEASDLRFAARQTGAEVSHSNAPVTAARLSASPIPGHPSSARDGGGTSGWKPSPPAKRDSKEPGCAPVCSGNNMRDGPGPDPQSIVERGNASTFSAV